MSEDPALRATLLNESIGRYRVESVLGQGGMGIVVRARAPDGTVVALKSIRTDRATPELRARFAREAAIRLEHPNIVRTIDTGVDQRGQPFIAFELLQGESLQDRLDRERTLTPGDTVGVLRQACAGLEAAHRQGIVHRDLKPANVFLCRDGTVKLLDFGIALVRAASRLTGDAMLLGTPEYLSPEQARGAREIDARTDVWALGVLGYESLSGVLPFQRDSPLVLLLAIIQNDPDQPLHSVARSAPPDLCDAIMRCLHKLPEDRWPTAAALARALDGIEVTQVAPAPSRFPPAPRAAGVSIRPDELRVLVVLLARGVEDVVGVEAAVRAAGGEAVPILSGDVVGVFGTSAWRGDEARRAASAGIALRHLARSVAISSGHARAAGAGVVGEGLVWAQRVCELPLDGVAIDERTVQALGTGFVLGEARTDDVVELLAEIDDESGGDDADPGELIGRRAEIAALSDAIEAAGTKRTVVLLSGPAGIGKTRLRREAERMIVERDPNAFLLVGSAEPFERDAAFGIFAAALRRHARKRSADRGWPLLRNDAPPLAQRQAVLSLAREAIADRTQATRSAEFIGALLGVPFPESADLAAARRDPELMADRLRLALVDYLGHLVARGRLALMLEDLQWADGASVALISELSRRFANSPLFLLLTLRSASAVTGLVVGPDAVRVELTGIGIDDVRALATRSGQRSLSESVVRALADRTEGNPLFVEQIAAAVGAGKASAVAADDLPLPFTVEAAIQARLDELPDAAREACKVASIYGRPVQIAEIEALGVHDARDALALLEAWHLLEPSMTGRTSGGVEVRFRSTLVAAVAYRTIAHDARAALHRQAATYLAGRPAADHEEVAVHHERGKDLKLAAVAYARAAIEAGSRGDADRTLRCSARALELGAPPSLQFALHSARAFTLSFLRRRGEQKDAINLALAAARSPGERARALTDLSHLHARLGDHAAALTLSAEAIIEAERSGETEVQALARAVRGRALALADDFAAAIAEIAAAAALARSCAPRVQALVAEAGALAAGGSGDIGGALDQLAEATRLFALAGDVRRAAANEGNLADCYNRIGEYAAAESALLGALEGCRRVGNRSFEGYVLANLGYALARQGRAGEALAALNDAGAVCDETGDARLGAFVMFYRARALLTAQRYDEARGASERALASARAAGQEALAAAAVALASRVALASGDLGEALLLSERALAARDALGSGGEDDAEIFLARVYALRAAGRLAAAEAIRARGADRVREIAAGISYPEWRDRFVHGVAENRELLGLV